MNQQSKLKTSKISFFDQQAKNKFQSVILLIGIFVIFMLLAYAISLAFGPQYTLMIFFWAIILAFFYIILTYFNAEKITLMVVRAKPADKHIYVRENNILNGLALAAGIPKPKLFIMPYKHINAFATGRNPKTAVVCLSEGATKLSRDELEGVIAHEMSHIKNYDIRFMTLVAVMVGVIAIIARVFWQSLWFGGGFHDDNKKGNIIIMIIAVSLMIIAPILVKIIQLAISRRREFMADASAVQLTRNPNGLIKALIKIKEENKKIIKEPKEKRAVSQSQAITPLFITSPFGRDLTKQKITRGIAALFSTHPPIDRRIELLKKM